MKFDDLMNDFSVSRVRKSVWANLKEYLQLPPVVSWNGEESRGLWCKLYGYDGNADGEYTFTELLVMEARDNDDNWEVWNPPQPSASVVEKARELLAREYADDPVLAEKVLAGTSRNGDVPRAIRAIESALTTAAGGGGGEEALAELIEKWRGVADTHCAEDKLDRAFEFSMNRTLRDCADELEAALGRGGRR